MNQNVQSGVLWLPPQSQNEAVNQFSDEERARLQQEELRHFPQPGARETLWRYLEHYKFEDLVRTRSLYLCQVTRLQDIDPNEGLMNRHQLEAMRVRFKGDERQFGDLVYFHEHIRQRAWVTCFSLSESENAQMWEQFCGLDPTQGVVVRTTYDKLLRSLVGSPEADHVYTAKIVYEETSYMPWKIGYLLYRKLPQFAGEREVRVCVCQPGRDLSAESCTKGFVRLPVSLPRLIQRVYVRNTAPESYFRTVQGLIGKYVPNRQARVQWSRLRTP